MKTVKFDATVLTAGQRRRLAEQQHVRSSFINPILAQQVEEAIKAVEALKERWFFDYEEKGTLCIADWVNF
ncbi:hypothetical protein PspS35_14745 [Pseudomonas sp. S35]|uniref:hypothetical protein n=1 Tax=Pseudomonas sp. S35 TaxID=1573719 RepID=UPI00132EB3D7|nr:hypothetical protein [Pseudomonas sp. S35]QHF44951.1 hypothetical protein PspS35_14615 [Pseudomonas sp. S35]QHF44964.1 hypothetical protein PspS35_14680 [Pseudomonas sp. S35]QHF44977.1 hypothetical protein PspS35_14745 [Pseudomonas sp. S35]